MLIFHALLADNADRLRDIAKYHWHFGAAGGGGHAVILILAVRRRTGVCGSLYYDGVMVLSVAVVAAKAAPGIKAKAMAAAKNDGPRPTDESLAANITSPISFVIVVRHQSDAKPELC